MNTPTTAAVFPGQGAQCVGMGADLAARYPAAAARFEEASAVLGLDLRRLCAEGPVEELTRSDRAQPAIFVVSAICAEALAEEVSRPNWAAAAGLSSGEWTALWLAGALSFEDTVRVLAARGRFMQEACETNPGGMVSVIGLPEETLQEIAAASGAEIANLNSPEQTVLSGRREAVEAAARLAAERGARRVVPLNVAGAFHSSLMAPAARRLAELLAGVPIRSPRFPVLSNVTGQPHGTPEEIRARMVEQVTSPVRWVDCVQTMRAMGVSRFIEAGPGRVLSGLIRRIDRDAEIHNICDSPTLDAVVRTLAGAG
ncbi:MAG: ACP S-malonyltransferase [Kiritimatiellae bacterium]|nr:ACP S-malonyltransferase [Kiritimatiellia bacterium]